MIQFGKKIEGKEYKDRPGVYALILSDDGLLGCVEGKFGGLMLAGGGIDNGETDEEALRREIMEEMVREVALAKFVGEANEYIDHPEKGPINKICKYFITELVAGEDGEGDRVTRWVIPEEFIKNSFQEAHAWAVKEFLLSK